MPTAARLALAAWRHEPRLFTIVVRGIDLTGKAMLMQVRLAPDTPGAPLLALATGAGLQLASVTNDTGLPVSTISGTITQAQLEALPYAGEIGEAATFAFNLQLAGVTRAFGTFAALATVNGADNAPANRPAGYGSTTDAGGLWDTATLAIDTDTIEITVDGLPIVQKIAADLAAQAQVTTAIGAALAGAVAAVPVNSNPNELSAAVPTPGVGTSFEVLIVVTNTADTYLTAGGVRLHVTNGGGVAMPAGSLATGTIVALMYSPGGAFVVEATRSVNQSPAILASLGTITAVTETMAGAPIAYPVGGNPNEIIVPDAIAPAVNATFEVLLTATNTGETYLTAGGVRLRIADGGGTSIAAGGLLKNTIVSLNRSPGGAFVLNGSRPIVAPPSPSGADDPDVTNNPWGQVGFLSSGARSVANIQKYIVVPGSSNAHPDYVPAAQLPALLAASYLNEFVVGDNIVFNGLTTAAAGAPMVTIMAQLATCAQFQAGQASFVVPFFWMNDARTLFYHSQGGVLAQIGALRAAIPLIRAKGAEPVLVAGFHPDPRAPTVALDPNFFADPSAFPSGGLTQEMDYPAFHAAPVDPQAHMWPAKSSPTVVRDWTGAGFYRTGYLRLWHVNRLMRQLAESAGCVLLDLEASTFRNIVEKLPDLDAGLDTYYDQTNPLHPKAALYDAAVSPVLRQWAHAVAQGRTDRRVFTGY